MKDISFLRHVPVMYAFCTDDEEMNRELKKNAPPFIQRRSTSNYKKEF